jgi:hypothetical protein
VKDDWNTNEGHFVGEDQKNLQFVVAFSPEKKVEVFI